MHWCNCCFDMGLGHLVSVCVCWSLEAICWAINSHCNILPISMTSIKRPIITGTGYPGRGFARTKLKMITSFWHPWKASTEETCTSIINEKMLAQKLNKFMTRLGGEKTWMTKRKQESRDIRYQETIWKTWQIFMGKVGHSSGFCLQNPQFRNFHDSCYTALRMAESWRSGCISGLCRDRLRPQRRTKQKNLEKSQKKEGRNKLWKKTISNQTIYNTSTNWHEATSNCVHERSTFINPGWSTLFLASQL